MYSHESFKKNKPRDYVALRGVILVHLQRNKTSTLSRMEKALGKHSNTISATLYDMFDEAYVTRCTMQVSIGHNGRQRKTEAWRLIED